MRGSLATFLSRDKKVPAGGTGTHGTGSPKTKGKPTPFGVGFILCNDTGGGRADSQFRQIRNMDRYRALLSPGYQTIPVRQYSLLLSH